MNLRIAIAVVLVFIAYSIYSWYSIQSDGFDINSQQYTEVIAPLRPVEKSSVVAAGGPNTPSERAPSDSVIVPPEEPYDPQEQPYESAEHPNRLRYPERLYGPGLEQDDKTTAVESGIASKSHQKTMNAYETFGPEFAQNGGAFMDTVMANDTALNTDYSSV